VAAFFAVGFFFGMLRDCDLAGGKAVRRHAVPHPRSQKATAATRIFRILRMKH
jgi:hypothetical protein